MRARQPEPRPQPSISHPWQTPAIPRLTRTRRGVKVKPVNEFGEGRDADLNDLVPKQLCLWTDGQIRRIIPEAECAMTDQAEFENKFWRALRSDMTLMLGL